VTAEGLSPRDKPLPKQSATADFVTFQQRFHSLWAGRAISDPVRSDRPVRFAIASFGSWKKCALPNLMPLYRFRMDRRRSQPSKQNASRGDAERMRIFLSASPREASLFQ